MRLVVAFLTLLTAAPSSEDALVAALRERLLTAESIAMAKFNSGAPVEDRSREKTVIFSAVHQAANMGLDADLALSVFSAQIEASKNAQRAFLLKWKGRSPFSYVPDLSKEIRPKLDGLTTVILKCLKNARHVSGKALQAGPKAPEYDAAWKTAIRPILRSPVVKNAR